MSDLPRHNGAYGPASGPYAWLSDPWARQPIPLNGPFEKTTIDATTLGFVTGLLGLGAAFILFQLLVTPIALIAQIVWAEGGMESLLKLGDAERLLSTYPRELIVSNSVGQIVALGGAALLMGRLHSSTLYQYLRLRRVDWRLLLLAVLGVLGLQPVVQWLAEINRMMPVPEGLRLLDESQLEMIRQVLQSDLGLVFNVTMLAVVPGVCEELLFRGYAQRQFERAAGTSGGILLSGVLFGLYHLRPSQLLPLVVLGLYLAYVTWRTGSLWPAIVVHFVHNAIAVGFAHGAQWHAGLDVKSLETIPMPWYVIVIGFVIVVGVLYVFHPFARQLQPD